MGDDLIIECVNENGRINMYSSYTSGPPNYGVTRLGVVCILFVLNVCNYKGNIFIAPKYCQIT